MTLLTYQQSKTLQFRAFITYCLAGLTFLLITTSILIPKGSAVLWINGNHTPFQDWFFSRATLLGEGLVLIPIFLILLFVRFQYALTFVLVVISNGIIISFLKRVVFSDLKRPITFLDNSILHFIDGISVHTSYSFPSGHTATAFAIATTLALCLKNKSWSIVLLLVALVVGYSRMYLLQHFLVDVAAGALIGIIIPVLVMKLNVLKAKPWTQQRIQISFKKRRTIQPSGR